MTNINYTLPAAQGSANSILSNNGSGTLTWTSIPSLGGVIGGGSSTQVAFWNSDSSISGTNNLWWDNVDTRLGIGTNTPSQPFAVKGNELIGGSGNQLQLQGTGTGITSFQSGAQGATNIDYTLPTTAPPVNGAALTSTTAGVMSWTTSAGISGSGAATQVAFWNSANSLTGTNNLWWDNVDTRLGIGTNTPSQPLTVKGNELIGGSGNQLQLQGTGTGITSFQSGAQGATNINYTLPTTAPPVNGAALTSTTAGVMSWTTSASVIGGGAATQVAFWNSANSLTGTNNLWWDNVDTRLGIGTNTPSQPLTVNGNELIGGSGNQLQLQGTGTGITSFQSGAQGATNINYTLPTTAPPVNGAALTSTTAGVMSWTDIGGTLRQRHRNASRILEQCEFTHRHKQFMVG